MPTQKKAETSARVRAEAKGESGSLHLYGSIGGWSGIDAKEVAEAVEVLSKKGAKTLAVFVNSPGGDAFAGIAIFNALKRFEGKRTIHVDGLAASAASTIAMAGEEIRMGAGALMMIHNPHGFEAGEAKDMRKMADDLDTVRSAMLDVYVQRTGGDRDEIGKWCDEETWMDGKTALARGFATSIEVPDEDAGEEEESEDDDDSMLRKIAASWKHAPEHIARRFTGSRISAAIAAEPRAMAPAKIASAEPKAKEANVPTPNDKKQPEKNESNEVAAAQARADFYEPFIAEIKALTGKDALSESIGVLTAWKSSSESAAALAKENTELKAQYAEGESTRLVEAAVRDGRLPPARREQAMGIGAKSVDGLKAFLEALTPLPVAMQNRERPMNKRAQPGAQAASEGAPGDMGSGVKLTRKQKLALHGIDHAAFLAHMEKSKAEHAAAGDEDDDE